MPAGRPTLLTPEVIEDFRRLLPAVLYLETVGDFLGVSRITWRNWVKRGAKEAKRLLHPKAKPKPEESLYLEFFYTHKKALAEGEIADLSVIKKAAEDQFEITEQKDEAGQVLSSEKKLLRRGEWQAAAWRLERRFPARWGRKDKVTHAGGVTIQTVEGVDEGQTLGQTATDPEQDLPPPRRGA